MPSLNKLSNANEHLKPASTTLNKESSFYVLSLEGFADVPASSSFLPEIVTA